MFELIGAGQPKDAERNELSGDRQHSGGSSGWTKDVFLEHEKLKNTGLSCTGCSLRQGCRQVVFADGNPGATLMMVGEAPGADEDRLGLPFVGRAGQLLDRILSAAEIRREEIYITNVVKCRPPGNRLPAPPEVASCLPFLQRQIELVNPEVVLCLGALATRTLIDPNTSITASRGRWKIVEGRRYLPTFHPAALLRDPGKKKLVWEDFKELLKYYRGQTVHGGSD